MKIIDYVLDKTNEYIKIASKETRKRIGQFFTSKETAIFMASLFDMNIKRDEISILDPGAGSGILSAALIQRIIDSKMVKKINLTCYETDEDIVNLLEANLYWIKENSNIDIEYRIIDKNYIISQDYEYNNFLGMYNNVKKYDLVICNPPYKKIGKKDREAIIMSDVCYGSPNLYFLFMQMSNFNLKENGEMVFIVPRSWTSGAYFKKFREEFLEEMSLEHIHLFTSRDKVFDKESVLQETMIIKAKKTRISPEFITITSNNGNFDFKNTTIFEADYDLVVSKENKYIYLITNEEEANTIKQVKEWKDTLPSLGLKMKTGLTVDFRNSEVLRDRSEEEAVPLFYSQHIKDGKVVFPMGKDNEYILNSKKGLLQENKNYLFVKRFTSKEEKRRLQCGVYLAKKYPEYERISTQNKLNFITGFENLSECLVYGLYVVLNSSLYDQYYRILNGSTQVNSTEINSMPVPPLEYIENMGKDLINIKDMSEKTCDEILGRYIYA